MVCRVAGELGDTWEIFNMLDAKRPFMQAAQASARSDREWGVLELDFIRLKQFKVPEAKGQRARASVGERPTIY